MRTSTLELELSCEDDTKILGRALAQLLSAGDVVFLKGPMGAGKSALARAAIQSLNSYGLAVPSPSFTLVYPYSDGHKGVYHADLYRLTDPEEVYELGLADCLKDHALFVEWPEHGEGHLPKPTLIIDIEPSGITQRRISVMGVDEARLHQLEVGFTRQHLIAEFLSKHDLAQAHVQHIAGDASARRYLRLFSGASDALTTYVLMDWPHGPDGPPVYDGQPYSKIACLAEATPQFCQMVRYLKALGLSAPILHEADEDAGLILLEDLGSENLQDMPQSDPARPIALAESVATLTALHEATPSSFLPQYDAQVIWFETTLFLDWYLPAIGIQISEEARQAWKDMWHNIAYRDLTLPSVTVLRDFHSPNIIWLRDRQASQRIGLIDVQDALLGSPAYDLASLLQDARVDMDHVQEEIGLSRYCEWRRLSADVAAQLRDEYDILGVQRNLKIAGIFHRLNARDGKPHYLNHLPRIEAYLARGLARPALAPLREWLGDHAPTWHWKSDDH